MTSRPSFLTLFRPPVYTAFDSSYKRDKPLEFTLGSKSVIEGWEKGLQGICEGEVRELTIPSRMAYGERGAGGVIPPMSTLIFKVELVEFGNASTDEL
jgi:FKBP-type peptidyl-prolyl cis-trans isomerase